MSELNMRAMRLAAEATVGPATTMVIEKLYSVLDQFEGALRREFSEKQDESYKLAFQDGFAAGKETGFREGYQSAQEAFGKVTSIFGSGDDQPPVTERRICRGYEAPMIHEEELRNAVAALGAAQPTVEWPLLDTQEYPGDTADVVEAA